MASFDQPIIWQLEEMIKFCEKHEKIYIYGAQHNQKMIGKYLSMCSIEVEGYVVSDEDISNYKEKVYSLKEIKELNNDEKKIGFLLGLSDYFFNAVIKNIFDNGFNLDNIYMLSEYNKRNIAYKMTPRPKERMWIEVNVADHCNLNCQMCDHFSPLAKPYFLDLQSFENDMKRLAELSENHIDILKLQGGEPLLNDNMIEYIKITRKYFPKAIIFLFTDGILLKKWETHKNGNLWQACHDYKVRIEFTVYPLKINVEEIKNLAIKYDVHLDCFSEVGDRNFSGNKRSVKHPFVLEGNVEKWQFISCYQFNESITLRDGKLYTCPMIPYVKYFNEYFNQNLEVTKNDYIDIYEANNYEELAEFMTHRTDFCRYCNVKKRRSFEWQQSKHDINEYVD